MIRCTTLGWSPSALCYEICVLAYRCEALKEWERRNVMNNKPTVFNYQEYVGLKGQYEDLLLVNEELVNQIGELQAAVERLLKERTNLEIKVRILEERVTEEATNADDSTSNNIR